MAFPPDDQTDEDFFDKLVDDDIIPPNSHPDRALSSLSLPDDAAEDTPLARVDETGDKHAPTADENIWPAAASGGGQQSSPGGGSKGTSVKVVQWNAFSIDSQEPFDAGGFGSSSDFLTENAFAEPESSFVREPATEQQNAQYYGSDAEQASDMDNTQYWENMYPGWKYDHSTGQWYQVDSCGNAQPESYDATAGHGGISESSGGMSYLQQSTSSVLETIAEDSAMSSVSSWNQGSYGASEYPPNMLFDPQYPGWYYDSSTQQWYALESYTQAVQGTASTAQGQATVDRNASGSFVSNQNYSLHSGVGQHEQDTARDHGTHELRGSWDSSSSNDHHHNLWQPEVVDHSGQIVEFPMENQAWSFSGLTDYATSHKDQQISFKTFEPVSSHTYRNNNSVAGYQGFVPAESMHHFNQTKVDQSMQKHLSDSYYSTQNSANYAQEPFQGENGSYSQLSYVPSSAGRSPDGRPPHALVAFGFGGKLIVIKDDNTLSAKSDFGSQGMVGGSVSILSLMEAVLDKVDASTVISGSGYDYFHALCQQSFPGPLSGGNAATKDVTKWIDQRIMSCKSPSLNFQKSEQLRLLLSLLRISCQHYGKLRSPFGADPSLEGSDSPELAVTKLFAGKNSAQMREYGSFTHCIQNLPSEGQLRATAVDVQTLLVSGRRKEALQCAQEGQLWGPALVLAAQLGEKFYVDTVRQMAHLQFISGSPLRTLCLLIAGQPADVFSGDCLANSLSGAVNAPQPAEIRATAMLDGWEENLAIITANRTKDDELVIIHLGDCLWKERGEITAAHTCYLVAEANFESYSDSARLCLIGADHWKYPRTYASPEAIQRTEMYEYSKVLGNSQFILLPFQPYKLIYAYMLAEVGKVADSLRYCQASLKLLKNSGRAPEVDTWKSLLSSLEDRLRAHQQGGYSTNLDPAKLVGKLFTSIDRSIHRMIGAPPPLPPMPENNKNGRENYSLSPKVSNSQSTMAMSSLIPSASVEGISELTADSRRKPRHNRSISEPNFGGTPKQDAGSADAQGKAWGGPSRFGRIGSQLLQKTMGWVARSRPDHQAKLGERNKFYYDEKLKRWVEEGAEPPAEEAALPPPPTTAVFQNGTSDYNISSAIKSQGSSPSGGPEKNSSVPVENNSGIPPIPYSQNQFSARGRMGVRSRYVDTFNKGAGASTNTFQSTSASSMKPAAGAKFFIPSMHAPSDGHGVDAPGGGKKEATIDGEPCTSTVKYASPSSPTSSSSSPSMQPSELTMPRFPSMENLNMTSGGSLRSGNCSVSIARRASWSGTNMDAFNPKTDARKPTGDGHDVPSSLTSNDPSPIQSSSSSSLQHSGGNAGYELHEVGL